MGKRNMTFIKTSLFLTALFFCFGASPVCAYEIEALPGALWGSAGYDNDDFSGSGVLGFINQGIQWVTLPGDVAVVTYAEYRHRSRTKNPLYYDAGGPAVGLELTKDFMRAGVNYYWERFPVLAVTSNRAQAYVGWYIYWNANKDKKLGSLDMPGSSWATLSYDNDDYSGSGVLGFINQGVTLYTLPGGIPMTAFAEYRHKSRSKNQQYYDSGGPAVGLEFQKGIFSWGAAYYWEHLPFINENSNRAQLYLTVYTGWDLKKLSSTGDKRPSDFHEWTGDLPIPGRPGDRSN
jgi:hypothetical protein